MASETGSRDPVRAIRTLTPCLAILLFALLFHPLEGVYHPADKSTKSPKGKICIGTNGRMSVPSNRVHHYRNLRERYTNCSYVDGNLELTWIEDENLDLSFLQNIREVTGYVLVSHVYVRRVVLPKLQIIRGRTLFKLSIHQQEFALMISLCKMHTIEMPALRDILAGGVGLFNNYNLCHIRTINWKEIITGPGYHDVFVYNFTSPERKCQPCHESCPKGCWGEGPENCQKFSKLNCSPQCSEGRCFGPNPRECCHLFCAGGCTGPKQTDCLACRNFYDDGECTQECPSMQTYNPSTYSWENNPRGKYAYGATCVKNCPEHLLKDNGACVRSCPPNKTPLNGECVNCDGACPKTCKGVDSDGIFMNGVHAGNIDNFKGCTIIDGSISILDHSFQGFQHIHPNFTFGARYPKMHPDRLEVFSTLKEVTGFINIQGSHEDFKNLSYFRNLEIIGGRTLTEYFALYIVKTSLTSLGLQSLKKISAGSIGILENKDLCFANGVNWTNIKKADNHRVLISENRNESECVAKGLVCDPQCSSEGCWGPGPKQCVSCVNFKNGNECVENCNSLKGMYTAGPNLCKPCHEECASTCLGPGNGNCTKCKHVRDGPFCYASCPETKYNDNGECKPCHPNCVNGCTGPANTIGPEGCVSCEKAIINADLTVESCLPKDEPCPTGYYYEWVGPQFQGPFKPLAGKAICRKCHPSCKKCTGYGIHELVCQECTNYKRGKHCEDECPQDHYADENTQECFPCSIECRGCYGPDASHCFNCRNLRLYLDENGPMSNETSFNCTAICPPEAPYKIYPEDDREPYCSQHTIGAISKFVDTAQWPVFITLIVVFLVIVLVICPFFYQWRKKVKAKEEEVKMTRVLTGMEDSEPLRPSNVKPNLAKLRIVKEEEMRRGGILGYGAFGTVYKGVWVPVGENVKIPVAIKVLREGTSANTSKEFLEEAYIMASVEHPNLLQLLAVCMTSQMMLVTQLMPLGCLLDYVRNNKDRIGSKPLLNWCTQIARGMSYLEEKRLVHRDLAARNVLVQTPNCVKITDFGLAKLLDINEEVYKAGGGKMPIKWLALECIQHRIFTHKSDVWAFGVTVWELLTYGGRPYENVPARDVPELLEKGERLPQPHICTIEVYMVMVKCWMLDADTRPPFKELADDFAKMARDPGRYLVIQGDKFLRLPSYTTQQHEKDLLHTLTMGTTDGPETVMEADEYLQPQFQRPVILRGHQSSSTSSSPPVTPTLKQSADSSIPQNQHNWDRELLRYAQSNSAQSNGMPSRYCSDPLRIGKDMEVTDECYDAKPATVGDLKLNLPLDEDDYLMPSPQQTETTTTYMDIIGENKSSDEADYRSTGFQRSHPPAVGLVKPNTCVDNPEYIMNSDQIEGDIGIPVVGIPVVAAPAGNLVGINVANLPPVTTVPGANSAGANNVPGNLSRPYVAQKSSEEESDHEYYNDIDRLQRELQPLRRNETTV